MALLLRLLSTFLAADEVALMKVRFLKQWMDARRDGKSVEYVWMRYF